MSTDPSEIRAQIERTRASLSDNVDALADQANPAHMAQRQVSKAKRAGGQLLDRLLGAAEDVKDAALDTAHGAASGVRVATDNAAAQVAGVGQGVGDAPRAAARQTQGNPLAAGMVAFGIGLLIAAAFPASRKEEELAQAVKEKAQPLTDEVARAVQEVGDNLAEPARDAVASLQASAGEAVETIKQEGAAAVDTVKGAASDSASEVADSARHSADEVTSTARDATQS